jgi:hypothetical protein
MLWTRRWGDVPVPSEIFVLTSSSTDPQRFTWQMFADEWTEGTPIQFSETPPPGLYVPERAVWLRMGAQCGGAFAFGMGRLNRNGVKTGGHRQFQRGFYDNSPFQRYGVHHS